MPALLNASQVAAHIGYSYDYFRKEVRFLPGFPQPVEIPGRDKWHRADIDAWLDELPRRLPTGEALHR